MKRVFLVILSVVFFVSSTFAQLPPAQMRERLAGNLTDKVEKAAQEAAIKKLQEARSQLAIAYLSGMFGVVDEILTQYPELVNETIKGKDRKPVPMVYSAFKRNVPLMLSSFYNHGAECERCFAASLKRGKLTDTESMTLVHHLSLYGATDEQLLLLEDFASWVKVTEEIRITKYNTLARLVLRATKSGLSVVKLVLARATSDDPVIQQQIKRYRSDYEEIYSLKVHELLPLPKVAEPEIKITFLGQDYVVKNQKDVEAVRKAIKNAANSSYEYDKKMLENLRTNYDIAMAQLKKAQAQIEQADMAIERIVSKNNDLEGTNRAGRGYITRVIEIFEGELDVVLAFMKRFPEQDLKRIVEYNSAAKTLKINITYDPPLGRTDYIYDARPFTFGERIGVIDDWE